jgi:hypothetical protein
MEKISVTDAERDGLEAFKALDMAVYARKVFGMFSGTDQRITLRFENALVGAVLDRLGRDIPIVPDGESHFLVTADVIVSPQFFAWVAGFGNQVRIMSPDPVVRQMREYIDSIASLYH